MLHTLCFYPRFLQPTWTHPCRGHRYTPLLSLQGIPTVLADIFQANHYSLSKSTKLAYPLPSRVEDIPATLAFRRPRAYTYLWPDSGKLSFMNTRGRLTLEQGLPGPMSINTSPRGASMLPVVVRMASVSLA